MAEAPENTRAAFDAAARYPVDGIEFDVQLSRDNVPVIFHDGSLKKICGKSGPVSAYPYEKLQEMDWGAWYGETWRGESLMTLRDVLQSYSGRFRLYVEIKIFASDLKNDRWKRITDTVTEEIQRSVLPDRRQYIEILSFDKAALAHAAGQSPELRYVLNVETPRIGTQRCKALPDFLFGVCASVRSLTPEFVQHAHDAGCRAYTYSCNTPSQVQKATACGADVLMTDNPGWLTQYIHASTPDS